MTHGKILPSLNPMTQLPTPLPESYWVIPGRFLAGEYPGLGSEFQARRRLTALLLAGIDTFINLTWPNELPPYEDLLHEEARLLEKEVTCLRFPILDFGLPTPQEMTRTLDAIDSALADGRNLYLHCWGGVGRTGTTVGCYLVRHGMNGEQALQHLASLYRVAAQSQRHPRSPETPAQADFVRAWREQEEQ